MAARILHITLALLIYVSSIGLVLNRHFCRQELKETALFVKAPSCHESMAATAAPVCPMHQAMEEDQQDHEKDCCDDQSSYLKADQPQSFEITSLDLSPVFFTALVYTFFSVVPSLGEHSTHFQNYRPPPLVCDRPVLLQTFRC